MTISLNPRVTWIICMLIAMYMNWHVILSIMFLLTILGLAIFFYTEVQNQE